MGFPLEFLFAGRAGIGRRNEMPQTGLGNHVYRAASYRTRNATHQGQNPIARSLTDKALNQGHLSCKNAILAH